MILYLCKKWNPKICGKYNECVVRCTFSPVHVWGDNSTIRDIVDSRVTIYADATGCPQYDGKDIPFEFWAEVPDKED